MYNVQAVFSAIDNISGVAGTIGSNVEGLGSKVTAVGKKMMGAGTLMTATVTAPILGIGAAAIKTAGDFESQMNILSVAARSSGTAVGDLSKAALRVGADTELVGISASEAADAMTGFYKAGLDTTAIFGDLNGYLEGNTSLTGALRSAVDLAAASDLDLAASSDAVAIAMATFGLSAEQATGIADSFVRTADASVSEVGDLVAAMANVGPTAAQFGWNLQDVNTALGILSTRGISGSEAGTALKSMMTNMMR
ncbi:MAG: phage tail tape measure protein, partial [Planctomycetota bacterium]